MRRDFRTIQNVSDQNQDLSILTWVLCGCIADCGSIAEAKMWTHFFLEFLFLLLFALGISGINRTLEKRGPSRKRNALLAIAVGGGVAGAVDILQASIEEGWDIPKVVAAGVLGEQAFHGGVGTWFLGMFLHFCIAFSAAAVYYAASRKLPFLTEYPLVCGLCFGGYVDLVMHLIVLPLSALHTQDLNYLLPGLLQKMVVVGLPISFSVRRFAR
jgi:hypothetical protein